ncbi:MAG: hypothetical protein M3536_12175 [Actinomycetota bacterium]|nr:hypothetical protein [Actinomycetota bacterium]
MSESVDRIPYVGAGEDAHGNETQTYGAAVTLTGYGFDPGSSSEPRLPGQGRVIVEPTLYGPYSMPFLPRDRVIVRGVTYEIEGVVRQWKHMFTNREAGAVVTLRMVTG